MTSIVNVFMLSIEKKSEIVHDDTSLKSRKPETLST